MSAPDTPPAAEPSSESDEAGALLKQAMQQHSQGQVQEAGQAYEQVLARWPEHPDALHLLGLVEVSRRRPQRALELITRALAQRPDEAMFHNNLGNVHNMLEQLDDAELHYRRAVELDPERYDAVNNIGILQGRRGDLETAESIFKGLLQAAPGYSDARQNLASIYVRTGRFNEAVQECARGRVVAPRDRGLRRMLGRCYDVLGETEQAAAVYREWLQEEPDNVEALHYLSAYTGEGVGERATNGYVRAVFDRFADSFDARLADLDYRAPSLVAEVVARELGEPEGDAMVADAGCGTGLCGPLLKPYAKQLVGVDLSPAMLERAARRGLYDTLYAGDLTEFLLEKPDTFNLLVSADTLCYFGGLEAFAAAAFASLRTGGLLVFTVEAHDARVAEAGWRLQTHGRYSHRKEYVQAVLTNAGFASPGLESVVLRQEALQPVHGWLVHANKP